VAKRSSSLSDNYWLERARLFEGEGRHVFAPRTKARGGVDFGEALVLVAAVVAVILVVIPLLFFGVELIVFGVLVGGGLVARAVSGKPWVIEARSSDPHTAERRLEWHVRGWRKSGKLIDQVASDLAAGREPTQLQTP
jgi:hypothetical protein